MRRGTDRWRQRPLSARALAVAAAVGVLVVALAWWLGPGLFGATSDAKEFRVVQATVIQPADCNTPGARETVRFEFGGEMRDGTLTACGHSQDQRLRVAVPESAGAGLIDVRSAGTSPGYSDLRRPIGLALVALSCAGGGMYAFLVVRGPRRQPALI